jgi:hypothetical protein
MSAAEKKIHIFKRGRHVASNGTPLEFTEAHLSASAAAYDPAKHEAPLVIGHPKHDDPAYGWVQSLDCAEGQLHAQPHQVNAEFAEMVRAGAFKKISASFYTPDAPNNPVPGVYYLRHVGFLGAQPPAIKGLKQASFADAEQGVVEFADWSDMQNASLWRRMRDWIIGKDGLDEADKVIPSYAVESLEEAARKESAGATPINYQEQEMKTSAELIAEQMALDKRADEIKAKELSFAEREKKVKDAEAAAHRTAIAEFVTTLVKAGKVLPRDQAGLVAYMAGPNEAGVLEFTEGADKKSVAPDAWLKGFLEGLPKQVDYTEQTPPNKPVTGTVDFAAPPGYSVDPARLELHGKALAYQAEHPNTPYDAAVSAVSR